MPKIISTSDEEFIDYIAELIKKCEKVTIITGYYTADALDLLLEKTANKSCSIDIYIGKLFDKQIIKKPKQKNITLYLVKYLEQFMHAKMYVFETGKK